MTAAPRAIREGAFPQDIIRQREALAAADPAPSQEERSGGFLSILAQREFLGPTGFSGRRLSLNQRYEMRADALLAFAHYTAMVSVLTAKRHIACRNAQKAQMIDQCLTRIWGRWVGQAFEALVFGWQAQVKEFGLMKPGWQYIDRSSGEPQAKQVWDYGDVPMLVWEPFINLRPESVEPDWTDAGRFDGIRLSGGVGFWGFPTIPAYDMSGATVGKKVSIDRSLWVVNQRDREFGSIWGASRMQYAFKFWRAYELVLTILERSAELKGDPLTVVTFPSGSTPWGSDQKQTPNETIARMIAQQAKAGTKLVIPSDVWEDEGGKAPKWSISYVKAEEKLEVLIAMLTYFDTMKLRSMFMAEQGLVEGSGGTSSRNVAQVFGNRNAEIQYVFTTELVSTVNQYMIPQLSEQNMPWLRDEPAELVVTEFGDSGEVLIADLIRSKANATAADLPVDWSAALDHFGIPTLDVEAVAEAQRRAEEATLHPQTDPVKPDTKGNAGREADTGFYYEPREHIYLEDSEAFLAALPGTVHYEDRQVLAQTNSLRRIWSGLLAAEYEDFAAWIERDEDVPLSDADLADQDPIKRREGAIKKIISAWRFDPKRIKLAVESTSKAVTSIFTRAGSVELSRASVDQDAWNPEEKDLKEWINARVGLMVKSVDRTTRRQLYTHLKSAMTEDKSVSDIAAGIREHFSEFPTWRAEKIARTETSMVYNAATLFAARAVGGRQVQALDARHGPTDADCEDRDGQLFSIEEAFKENAKEHPNGTLSWRIMPRNVALEVRRGVISVEGDDDWAARVDLENGIVYLSKRFEGEEGPYLRQVVDYIAARS